MKPQIAQKKYVPGTSRGPRSDLTVLLQMAAEAERQKEIGARIKDLRGKMPQQVIADRVGVTLRAYQAWEAGGGIAWANYERLAEALGVTEEYILYGESGKSNPSTQLDRIEAKLDLILASISPPVTGPAVVLGEEVQRVRGQRARSDATSKRKPAKRRGT